MQVKKQQLELNLEQLTGSNWERLYIVTPAYLIYMQRTSYEVLGWMTNKLESRLPGETPTTSDMQMIPL